MKNIRLTSIFISAVFCAAVLSGCKGMENSPAAENSNSIINEDSSGTSSENVSENTSEASSATSSSTTTVSNGVSSATQSSATSSAASTVQNEPPADTSRQSASSESEVHTPAEEHRHDYTSKTVAASCTEKGFTTYTCSCGEQYNSDYVDALGHDYTKNVIKPTCENDGYSEYTCSRCKDQYTGDRTNALGHNWSDWKTVREATASSEGELRSECLNCGQTKSEVIPKLKTDINAYAKQVVDIVNAERAKEGLAPLAINSTLMDYAQLRSTEIVDNFAHQRPDGSSPLNYVMNLNGIYTSGENIAYGQSSPESVMGSWMNSPGHHANIMNADFSMIGVGCYEYNGRLYWTQIFAG